MMRFKLAKPIYLRTAGSILAVLLSLLSSLGSAKSQIVAPTMTQSVSWVYGQNITFTAIVSVPTNLIDAQLVLRIPSAEEHRIDIALAAESDRAISYTMSIEEFNLPPAATIEYMWEFVDANGQVYQGDATTVLYADNRLPWTWVSVREGKITVLTDGTSPILTQAALTIAADGQASAEELIRQSNSAEVSIFVYPDLLTMANSLRAHRLIVNDWVAAYSIPNQQIVFVAAEQGSDLMVTLERDIRHEMMHLAISHASGSNSDLVPAWFNEGLAIYASGDSNPELETAIAAAIESRVLPSLSLYCVNTFTNLPRRDAALAYAQSVSLVNYIVERFGPSKIVDLATAYAQGLDCNQGVEAALGISLAELESQWLRNLSTTEQALHPANSSILHWLIGWIASVVLAVLFVAPQPAQSRERSDPATQVSLPQVPSNPS